jgi:hypothetical protein
MRMRFQLPIYYNHVELEREKIKYKLRLLEDEHERLRKESSMSFHLGSQYSMKYYIHKMNVISAKIKALRSKRIRCPPNGSYCKNCYVLYDKACSACDTRGRVLEGFCNEKCHKQYYDDIRDGQELADDINWLFK